jgi:hypothetical protein
VTDVTAKLDRDPPVSASADTRERIPEFSERDYREAFALELELDTRDAETYRDEQLAYICQSLDNWLRARFALSEPRGSV